MIVFHSEDIRFNVTGKKREISGWVRRAVEEEGLRLGDVNVIFCSDKYLLEKNRKYLQHDYLTDIITFDYSEEGVLGGDLFISVDRVKDNAQEYGTVFHVELLRVIIHGIMHLAGYKDKSKTEATKMREREDYYLEKLPERLKGMVG